jgi:integrase
VIDFESQIRKNPVNPRPPGREIQPIRSFSVAQSSLSKTAVDRRADELDTIASVLPIDRRDELAELLTDQDIETLRHLVNEGMGENTLRALTSDLAYLQAWSLAATGASLPWPAPEALALKFVAHHLWQPEQREVDPHHGMPADVEQSLREQRFLRSSGPHAPDTVRRRLASWSTLTKWRGLTGAFSSPTLKSAIRLAVRATPRPRKRKSAKAVTGDVVSKRAIEPSAVNQIVKQRATLAGLEPGEFSAHGLRSGYLTEAANRGIPLPEAMEQSRHRSVQQASSYYNNATRRSGRAARML